jgi:hypothetical protein
MALCNLENKYQRFGEYCCGRPLGRNRRTYLQNVGTKLGDVMPERKVIGSTLYMWTIQSELRGAADK